MLNRRSQGFTAIDGVVVAGIAMMLTTVSLPAVQKARDAAREAMCKNNLRMLGLAMHNYHDAFKTFPPGIVAQNSGPADAAICQFVAASETCDQPGFSRASAFTLILPFLEERKTYNAYNMQHACCATSNATSTSAFVKAFVCPSNSRGANGVDLPYYGSKPGPTDYVMSMGGVGLFTCENPFVINTSRRSRSEIPGAMRRASGMFNVNSSISIDKMRDGVSNTIMVGESVGGPDLFVGRSGKSCVEGAQQMDSASTKATTDNAWSIGYIGSGPRGVGQGFGSVFAATAWNAWYDSNSGKLVDSENGKNWFAYPINEGKLKFNRPTWAKSSRPETDAQGRDGSALPSSLGSVQGFRSRHPGFAQFLMADGTVRPLTDDTDPQVLVSLSTIAGREPIQAGQ